jgi:hypothetical protein
MPNRLAMAAIMTKIGMVTDMLATMAGFPVLPTNHVSA